ncbi:MAG TPA: archaeal heat shock protein Hsp20 [Nitrososphaerales archaeon]|nr:archaeal heat shock protein Hsp20 [Nitrososphaerales archaeon]
MTEYEGEDDDTDAGQRRRRNSPFGGWPIADLDDVMQEMERAFAEQFRELEKELPRNLIRESIHPDGTVRKEIGPIVYGYSVTVGPDGKPVIREFGNVRRREGTPWKGTQDRREPLVDVVTSEKDVRVIAELPGVKKDDIEVTLNERSVAISVDGPERRYYKELQLASEVEPKRARSSYNNGILEITLPLKTDGGASTKLKID